MYRKNTKIKYPILRLFVVGFVFIAFGLWPYFINSENAYLAFPIAVVGAIIFLAGVFFYIRKRKGLDK